MSPTATEAALIERWRSGDRAAFEAVVREHGGRLLSTSRRILKSEDEAQDVVQETLLSAHRAIAEFEAKASLSTWLHRIAINRCLMRLRSRKRRPEVLIDDLLPRFLDDGHHADPPSQWPSAATLVEQKELAAKVHSAIAKLPETHRTVLVLRDLEELDGAETAIALGITENAVKVRLHRARQALRQLLDVDIEGDERS